MPAGPVTSCRRSRPVRGRTDRGSSPPVHRGALRDVSVGDDRVDLLLVHPAAVAPAIAEVEHVLECVAGSELPRDLQPLVVEPQVGLVVVVGVADAAAVGEFEAVQVRRSQRATRCDRGANVASGRPTMMSRPGGGSQTIPPPPSSSWIETHVRATPRSYDGRRRKRAS